MKDTYQLERRNCSQKVGFPSHRDVPASSHTTELASQCHQPRKRTPTPFYTENCNIT